MNTSQHLAKQFRDLYFGPNWVSGASLKENLADISLEEALISIHGLNSIAALTYHVHYYVRIVSKVLEGGPLEGSDKLSFNLPKISTESEWTHMQEKHWEEGEAFAKLLDALPEEKLWADFDTGKYGNYYRNIQTILEHTHYHLGQIAIIKKMIRANQST